MPASIPCVSCNNDIPQPAERCPHCARPGIFWNVIAAEDGNERGELLNRYNTAKTDALQRGADKVLVGFERAVTTSVAVIARSESEVLRLATTTKQLYATYYEQLESNIRLPDGDEWDVVREVTDTVLFPKFKKEMRFGALSIDGVGVRNYGPCSMALRNEMISHRASVFEENSVLFMKHKKIEVSNPVLPKGFRAAWSDRAMLSVAKLATAIDPNLLPGQYSKRLLKQGASSADDDFIEVHIWGPISVLTMEKVTVTAPSSGPRETILKAVTSKLLKHNVTVA
ncbi:MAG TPA: hypothetical protein VGD61_12315 [Pyrinomonadaceae bacterium]